jgi:hypothetical protein
MVDKLIAYISQSRKTRRMPLLQLVISPFTHWGVSEDMIRHALAKRGYKRHIGLSKPLLSKDS